MKQIGHSTSNTRKNIAIFALAFVYVFSFNIGIVSAHTTSNNSHASSHNSFSNNHHSSNDGHDNNQSSHDVSDDNHSSSSGDSSYDGSHNDDSSYHNDGSHSDDSDSHDDSNSDQNDNDSGDDQQDHQDNHSGDDSHDDSQSCHNNNTAPVITLIGSTPVTITVGSTYNDLGSTANDAEDGDITSNIVTTGAVNTLVVGTYTITYNVTDSDGLSAVPVTRTINVVVVAPVNHPPIITLTGSTPMTINTGDVFTDPGATATDLEDGNITGNIVTIGTVNTGIVGSYNVVYSVTDSGGLLATTTRTINVVPVVTPPDLGKITFCMIIANNENVIATTSTGLPSGSFILNLATSTSFGSTTVNSNTWSTNSFAVNHSIISGQDAECTTFSNLPLGTYYYSQLAVSGSLWNTPKYNDGSTQSINNIFDFFAYSPELFTATTTDDASRNMNSDGQVVIAVGNNDKTVVVLNTFNPAPACVLPQINSFLTASTTVGQVFSYNLTSSTTPVTSFNIATSSIPAGLSFATTTGILSGTPTQVGTFSIPMTAVNDCGQDNQTLVITVNNVTGGGGGGGSSANIAVIKTADKSTANVGDTVTYTITVVNNGPDDATGVAVGEVLPSNLDFVSATSTLGSYSTTTSVWTIGSLFNTASTTLTVVTTVKDNSQGQTIHNTVAVSANENDPSSTDNSSSFDTVVNTPTLINPPTNPPSCTSNCGGGGGGGPIYPNNLEIYNESVVETVPGIAMVTWNTNLPATRRVLYDNVSHTTLGTGVNYGYANSNTLVSTPLQTLHGMAVSIDANKTYYFREVSTDVTSAGVTRIVIGKELSITTGTTGGNTPNGCYYLFDYLRKDFNNNPIEVKKLQVFLRDLEGFSSLQITGIYDDQTISALDAFQNKYKSDILTPWGHTAPTSYTYILTKKKVNEIYCKTAFPVNAQQQSEIDSYRNFLLGLKNEGVTVPTTNIPTQENGGTPVIQNDIVGEATSTATSTIPNTYIVESSTTIDANGTLASVSTTTKEITSKFTATVLLAGSKIAGWATSVGGVITGVLVIIAGGVFYLWYKRREEDKKIEIINKEIDLQ